MNVTVTPISVEDAYKMLNFADNLITPPAIDSDYILDPEVDYSHPEEPTDLIDTEENCQ
jgi:hypothetical protein